jgi:HlyD family secretion protein
MSCNHRADLSDAYGNFEAEEIIVSAEATGKIIESQVNEGASFTAHQVVGLIDSTRISLQIKQLEAQQQVTQPKIAGVKMQIATLSQQKENLDVNLVRLKKMFADGAATQKQLDDIDGQMKVIDKQIEASRVQFSTISKETEVLNAQKAILEQQLRDCSIKSPVTGIVLEQYTEKGEMAVQGKALFKIADLSSLDLRCYVAGSILSSVKLGQTVSVLIDKNDKENTQLSGIVTWISSEAEFTPKIIQTKEERVKQVYAVKVRVKNDGSLKIGMPGEVNFK